MTATITIVDYQMGNLRSVQKAIEHVGAQAIVTSDPQAIATAEKLILPGVGAFGDAMTELRNRGLVESIQQFIKTERPFFGICLGLQLLFDTGYEGSTFEGLGIIPGEVVRFDLPPSYKVPHMGWNQVEANKPVPKLLDDLPASPHFYFVHSFYAVPKNPDDIWLEAEYGKKFCAAIQRNHIYATQFHPEKSQRDGLQLLKNFSNL
jgi:imidazole glycerol-phosphate synthase subunit HisH